MEIRTATGPGVSLREVLPEAEFLGAADIRAMNCSADSRNCRAGDLFVALPGESRDGHQFVADAVARGAVAVLANRPVAGIGVPTCFVPDTRVAYGRVCQALVGQPTRTLKTIGVSGASGKTTTSHLIAAVLSAAGHRLGLMGTLGYFDGDVVAEAGRTTPAPPSMAHWLARMVAGGCTHAVVEISGHALRHSYLAGMQFDVAAVTNVRGAGYDAQRPQRGSHARLFDYLVPEGLAVVNADDRGAMQAAAAHDGPMITVGVEACAEVSATLVSQYPSEQTLLLHVGSETAPVRTHLIGAHNISNCLVAAGVGLVYGLDLSTIVRGLESVPVVPGRLERLECGQPFGVFVDCARTPDALGVCLDALREVASGRVICVFGADGERDRLQRPAMGRAVEARADLAVITTGNPRGESSCDIAAQLLAGFRDREAVRTIADRAEAIRWALSQARPGDCVLIAGKGHEEYQVIGDQRRYFDDREVARQWLYESPTIDELCVHG